MSEPLPVLEYERVNWEDAPSRVTPLSADNLNNMDNAIAALSDYIYRLENRVAELESHPAKISHIGMIVMSTTLDTMEKVIEEYGGTTWIQHSGYFLLGANTNVIANNASEDGGEASVILTELEMPNHVHIIPDHNHRIGRNSVYATNGSGIALVTYGDGEANDAYTGYEHIVSNSSGGGLAHNNMPPFKNVYIWERTA